MGLCSPAALLLALAAFASAVPQIPCVFSAKMEVTNAYPLTGTSTTWTYTLHNVNRSRSAMIGQIPDQHPGEMTLLFKWPHNYTVIMPFFDHHTCATLPMVMEKLCWDVDPSAVVIRTERCPTIRNRQCNVWYWGEPASAPSLLNYFYIVVNSTTPSRYEQTIVNESGVVQYIDTMDFLSWSDRIPPDSVFEVPKHQPCSNFVDTPVNKTAAVSRFAASPRSFHQPRDLDGAETLVNDPEKISRISALATTWTAGVSPRFNGMTHADARKLTSWPTARPHAHVHGSATHDDEERSRKPIPESFDTRVKWPQCTAAIIDQDWCGGCWALAASSTMSDRVCIAKNASANVPLSQQWLLSCTEGCTGCDGGYVDVAWQKLLNTGIVLDSCIPYAGDYYRTCPSQCDDGTPEVFTHLESAYSVYRRHSEKNVKAIQREIMRHGPVEAGFWAFDDFYNYINGVYIRTPGSSFAGGHAIKIVGWGVDATAGPYWTCVNSWGPTWGENGTFKIRRGTNECTIEDQVATGIPEDD